MSLILKISLRSVSINKSSSGNIKNRYVQEVKLNYMLLRNLKYFKSKV